MKKMILAIFVISLVMAALMNCENPSESATKSSNADLSDLTVSTGTLSPAFASGTTSYSVSVPNAITGITITGTISDKNAFVTTNNGVEQSLIVGTNTITITVIAEDGTTTKDYAVTVTREDALPDISVLGNWHMNSWKQDVLFSNTNFVFNDGNNPGLTGDILSYDNANKSFIIRWTNHPAYTGRYQKWVWVGSPMTNLNISDEYITLAEAESATDVKYSDTVNPILFCDYFNRENTISPNISNTDWTVQYAPNTVSISNNMLRLGTSNATQSQVVSASKINLSSDFCLSANFLNMRFSLMLVFDNGHSFYFMPLNPDDYYIIYPDGSTPVLTSTITSTLSADTTYKLEIKKAGNDFISKIYQGTTEIYSNTYAFTGSEDFSSVKLGINGGGASGYGTGDVYVDNVKIIKL